VNETLDGRNRTFQLPQKQTGGAVRDDVLLHRALRCPAGTDEERLFEQRLYADNVPCRAGEIQLGRARGRRLIRTKENANERMQWTAQPADAVGRARTKQRTNIES